MAEDGRTQDVPYRPDDRVMQGVIPYLVIPGKAAAAADFYSRAFGAKDIGRMPLDGAPGLFMHVQVGINGGALMLTDHAMSSASNSSPLPSGHLQLVVPDGQAWWDRAVAAGCTVKAPFERQFWGDDWGLLLDPFGIHWAVLTPGPQVGEAT
jgi:PhnB protein